MHSEKPQATTEQNMTPLKDEQMTAEAQPTEGEKPSGESDVAPKIEGKDIML